MNTRVLAAALVLLPLVSLALPEPARALVGSLAFPLLLLGIGRLLDALVTFESRGLERGAPTVAMWLLSGTAVFVIGALALAAFGSLAAPAFSVIALLAAAVGLWHDKPQAIYFGLGKNRVFLTLAMLLSLVPFVAFRSASPYPYQPGVDLFNTFLPLTNDFLARGVLDSSVYSVNLPLVPLLAGVSSFLSSSPPIGVYYYAPAALYLLLSLGAFLLAYRLTGSEWYALAAAVMLSFFTGWGTTADMINFLPRNLLAALFPFAFLAFAGTEGQRPAGTRRAAFLLLSVALLFMIAQPRGDPFDDAPKAFFAFPHGMVGPLLLAGFALAAILALVFFSASGSLVMELAVTLVLIAAHTYLGVLCAGLVVAWSWLKQHHRPAEILLGAAAAATLLLVALPSLAAWVSRLWPVGLGIYDLAISDKIGLALQVFSAPVLAFAALGALLYFKHEADRAWLAAAVALCAFLFLPVSFTFRALGVATLFVAFLAAYPVIEAARAGRSAAAVAVFALIAISFFPVMGYYSFQANYYSTEGIASAFTLADASAAAWLQENAGPDDVILSDPSTTAVYASLSGLTRFLNAKSRLDSGNYVAASSLPQVQDGLKAALSRPVLLDSAIPAATEAYSSASGASERSRFFLVYNCKTDAWVRGGNYFAGTGSCDLPVLAPASMALEKVFEIDRHVKILLVVPVPQPA